MPDVGYKLSSEEHPPNDLVRHARRAEEVGFSFAMISDHFHPWIDRQGASPFVWSVIGAIAHTTDDLELCTGVTCPTIRTHPAIVAHAAATAAAMMPGRFWLGVGSGENLNEHVLGDRWPETDVRLEMLEEAVEIIRALFEGGQTSHHGRHYTLENARLYTLPDEPPPIHVAAGGRKAASLAGRIGDGLINVAPKADVIEAFEAAGGAGKPRFAEVAVCWAEDEAKGRKTALEYWPNAGVPGQLSQELPLPAHFEQASSNVTEEQLAETVACGPDPQRHLASIREFLEAGYDNVFVHQIGPDQEGFFEFYERAVLPKLR